MDDEDLESTIEWNPEETTTMGHTEINTELVTKNTVMVCPQCNGKNYIKNNKCIRCDYNIV